MCGLQSTGGLLDNLAFTLNIFGFAFVAMSLISHEWEHGVGKLPSDPAPKNATEAPKPPEPDVDVYFWPFAECGKFSGHTNACSKMYTIRACLIFGLIIQIFSLIFERLFLIKNKLGESKTRIVCGSLWLCVSLCMIISVGMFNTFITKDNQKFYRRTASIPGHPEILTWKHGEAYNFGWIACTLELVSGVLMILVGWKF